jgi:2-polyprenyl-3-methyl-5-hydroxy-6-metoxy-1,4-benzoquinol methylase
MLVRTWYHSMRRPLRRCIMPASAYDEIAEWYDAWLGSNTGSMLGDPFYPAVEPLIGDVTGQRICELACGQGRVARHLTAQGAEVVAVDISEKLLEFARRYEAADPRGIAYVRADVQSRSEADDRELAARGLVDEAFDGVICYMALMDIPELEPTLRTVSRILRPGGWFVFAILHPCFNSAGSGEQLTPEGWIRTVAGYFGEGYWRSDTRPGPPGKIGAYHRTLSTYVSALGDVGLVVERIAEPRVTGTHAERRPIWAVVSGALAIRCRKGRIA